VVRSRSCTCAANESLLLIQTTRGLGVCRSCEVTSQTVQHENSKHDNKLRLGNLQRLVMALLLVKRVVPCGLIIPSRLTACCGLFHASQDFLQGNLQNRGFQGLSLSQKHSPYSMKLKLDCSIDGRRGTWSFHMIPQDPGAIQKRELEEKDGKVK
jgi:hypothetical protein